MEVFQYTSVGRIMSKLRRDTGSTDIHESDIIEWIGEALEQMGVPTALEDCVAFIEVKNHKGLIPKGTIYINQLAYHTQFTSKWYGVPCDMGKAYSGDCPNKCEENNILDCTHCNNTSKLDEYKDLLCPANIIADKSISEETDISEVADSYFGDCQTQVLLDCNGNLIDDSHIAYYRPYFDLVYNYELWGNSRYYQRCYEPIRKANSTFYSVTKINTDCRYTYVVQAPYFKFSFKEGSVAVSYQRQKVDTDGYPMIPDNTSVLTALTSYVMYKMKYKDFMTNVPHSERLMNKAESDWHWYLKQSKNKYMMPDLDDLQDLQDQRQRLIPRLRLYDNFFGNQSIPENKIWNNDYNNLR